ncbi:hypothetical protein CAJAP_00698 [Camponotus japonicus]
MKRTVYFIFVITFVIVHLTMQKEVTKSTCNCAVFAVPGTEPIIQHMLPCNAICDQEGLETCQKLCIALVEEKLRSRIRINADL